MSTDIFTIVTKDGVTETVSGGNHTYSDGVNTAVIPDALLNPAAPPMAASQPSKWDWWDKLTTIVITIAKKQWP